MSHPDFRVAGKIFATLGYPDKTRGMVKLSPEEQHYFSKNYPDVFVPVKGVWGKRGATNVYLKAASKEVLAKAIQAVGACPGSGRTFLQQFGEQVLVGVDGMTPKVEFANGSHLNIFNSHVDYWLREFAAWG